MTTTDPEINKIADFPPLPTSPSTTPATTSSSTKAKKAPTPSTTSRAIILPIEEQRRPVLGEKLVPTDVVRAIMKATGADIEMSTSALTRTITLVIRGRPEQVEEASRMAMARLAVPQKCSIAVPRSCLGLIIGQQGRTVKALMQETGVRITVPRGESLTASSSSGSDAGEEGCVQVQIEGSGEGCERAKERITGIIREKLNNRSLTIHVIPEIEHFLLGDPSKRNDRLTRMADEFNVKLVYQANEQLLFVSGSVDAVSKAELSITEKQEKLRRDVKMITVPVPKHIHRHLVGSRGSILQTLEAATNCHFVIPPPDQQSDTVQIFGLSADVARGLQVLMEKCTAFHEEPVLCPPPIRSFLLHKHRADIRGIEKENGVQVRNAPEAFILVGEPDKAGKAADDLKQLIQSFASLHFDTLELPADTARHVIGRQGSGLDRVERDFSVTLVVDRPSAEEEQLLMIIGESEDSVIRAKEHCGRLIVAIENEGTRELPLDEKYVGEVLKGLRGIQEANSDFAIHINHSTGILKIRGPKDRIGECFANVTASIDAIRHHAVMHSYTVDLAIPDAAADHISLRSLRSRFDILETCNVIIDCKKVILKGAKKDVEAIVNVLKPYLKSLSDFTIKQLPLQSEFVGQFIGKGGRNIGHLTKKYSVDINVSSSNDQSTIIVSGPLKKVNECEREVLEYLEYMTSHSFSHSFKLPSPVINRLLTRQGEEIDVLQNQFDVRLSVQPKENEVRLEGTEKGVAECSVRLQQIALEEHEEEIFVDADKLSLLTGSFRSFLKHWQGEVFESTVVFQRISSGFRLRGSKERVESAVSALQDFIGNLETVYTAQAVAIEPRFHGMLIGQRGATIKTLGNKYNVAVDFPRPRDEEGPIAASQVMVAGERVDEAIAEMLRMCSEN